MPTTTGLKPSEVDLLVKHEYLTGFETYQPVGPLFFNTESPDRLNEKESVLGGDGDIEESADGAAYPQTNFEEIGTKTFRSVEYKRAYPVTELMQDFNNYGSIMKLFRKAGYRARYKQDDLLRAVVSGGFATTTTWDGDYLFSATHQIGTDANQTQSNLQSGALTKDNINAAYITLQTMKDHEGLTMPTPVSYLVVPAALAMKAWEYLNSPDDPETANRSKSFVNSLNIKLVVWPLLDAASTTAWFMLSDKMWTSLKCYQKVAPTMRSYIDENTGNLVEKVRFVQIQGSTDYLGTTAATGV